MLSPTDIQSIGDEIAIRWSDGSENYYPMERLRAWSPSAETAGVFKREARTSRCDKRELQVAQKGQSKGRPARGPS